MSFRFGDPGGRIYTSVGTSNVNLLAHWTALVTNSTGVVSVSAGNGRTTGSCLRFNNSANSTSTVLASKTLDAQATWGIAFALKVNLLPPGAVIIARLVDVASQQIELRLNADGTLSFTKNNGAITGATSTAAVTISTWVHIEMKVKIDPSAGTLYLAMNGVQQFSLTSQATRATANSSANVVQVGLGSSTNNSTQNYDFDDIIIYDGQTTDANGFTDITGPIGDCGLAWCLPTGAGTTTQFTPDSGSNYARVNEATPDGDTSYAEDATVGHIDTYAIADLASGVTSVKSLAVVSYAKKTDVGSRGMKTELRSAGANATHATEIALGNTYQYSFQAWGQDPNNGSAVNWTRTSVNALEAGQTVSS